MVISVQQLTQFLRFHYSSTICECCAKTE